MVMAQSLFAALRADGPVAVDVVAPPGPLVLTERMPEVREAIPLSVERGRLGLATRWSVGRGLRRRGYGRAIILPSSFKSALLPVLAGIPVRTGYRGELRVGLVNDVRELPSASSERNVRGYLALAPEDPGPGDTAAALTVRPPRLQIDAANQGRVVERLNLPVAKPGGPAARGVVALAPGAAFGEAKQWPIEHFRSLAARLAEVGHTVLILGGPAERPLGAFVSNRLGPNVHDLCGETSLTEAVDILGMCDVTVANDSGLMHVAAATGSHVVALYGPTDPSFAPPLTDASDIVYLGTDCSPCFKRTCPLVHHRCLRGVSPDAVFTKVLGALHGSSRG